MTVKVQMVSWISFVIFSNIWPFFLLSYRHTKKGWRIQRVSHWKIVCEIFSSLTRHQKLTKMNVFLPYHYVFLISTSSTYSVCLQNRVVFDQWTIFKPFHWTTLMRNSIKVFYTNFVFFWSWDFLVKWTRTVSYYLLHPVLKLSAYEQRQCLVTLVM